MTRIYSVRDGWSPEAKVIIWGASRFGDSRDQEMDRAIAQYKAPGDGKTFNVSFTPEPPRLKSPEQVQAQRIRNMKKRAARLPLFSSQIESEKIKQPYFTLEEAERHQNERKAYLEKWEVDFWNSHPPELELRLDEKGDFNAAKGSCLERETGN